MKIFLAALAAFIAVAAGGAVVAVPMVEKHAAQQIKEEIERDGLVSVEGVTVGLFDRRIEIGVGETIERDGFAYTDLVPRVPVTTP